MNTLKVRGHTDGLGNTQVTNGNETDINVATDKHQVT